VQGIKAMQNENCKMQNGKSSKMKGNIGRKAREGKGLKAGEKARR